MARNSAPSTDAPMDLLLTGLVQRVANVRHAVVFSDDGLVVSRSTSIGREEAERLAATSSGLMSLGRGICAEFDGGAVLQALIEMREGYLVLSSAGAGAHLAVIATANADVGVVAFEMNTLADSISELFGVAPRFPQATTDPSRSPENP
ncbi:MULTISPECIES: roadblock/LC7 domain-containing protein [Streptomyces]|uniref:Dynein regulation protein LC7 n=1 Tax=Streptomyces dengpaensis TaxID=2049881 RepID=A0ABM6STJ9_9ACTN|nr:MULTISPECIES: roadblock/LC7 domain-containing protein [Streptomyces]AVH58016.1 dynein regulation protein LC7 [Streptomyces dengpaensis]PIB06491.1 dynein regulation protein LC7 [Streptomyces sp. HG99]